MATMGDGRPWPADEQIPKEDASGYNWSLTAPAEVPELRRQLVTWLGSYGAVFYQMAVEFGEQEVRPLCAPRALVRTLVAAERRRVVRGKLYWVGPSVCELARTTAALLPVSDLHHHHLPAPSGLMVFAEPFAAYASTSGGVVEIVAASWGPWRGPREDWRSGGVWMTFYSNPAPLLPPKDTMSASNTKELAHAVSPILPDNECGWPFGRISDRFISKHTTVPWAKTLRATWALMQDPLIEVTRHRAGPTRMTRHGEHLGGTVHLVQARPAAGDTQL